jgi:UPF0755 protein
LKPKLLLVTAVFLIASYFIYTSYFKSNTTKFETKKFIYIKTGSTLDDVIKNFDSHHLLNDIKSFEKKARNSELATKIFPGKFEIEEGMSNNQIIKRLVHNDQSPVHLIIKKLNTPKDIYKKLTESIEADSAGFARILTNTYLNQYGLNDNQLQAFVLPHEYDIHWNETPEKIVEEIASTFKNTWNADRLQKAKELNMTPAQVSTLASIVECETNKAEDRPKVASTYLNRLKKGMPLQADPTCIYAAGDFTIKRVLTKHLKINSPYNTYMNAGLPPGPICNPRVENIDAVLNAPKTDYIFFCASERLDGTSNFASTNAEHEVNAKKYQAALDARGVMK